MISKGYTSKFTQQSLDWLPDSITDSTLSMSIVGSGSQNVTSIASMAIGVATSIAVTTSSYSSKTSQKIPFYNFNIQGHLLKPLMHIYKIKY